MSRTWAELLGDAEDGEREAAERAGFLSRMLAATLSYELLRDDFDLEPRGTVPIKGKGDVETWYLVGRRTAS